MVAFLEALDPHTIALVHGDEGAKDRNTADRFARVLEGVGLVRRDDERRDRLWVLGPQETHLFPDEAELEEQLKRANPKGRLLELCMRMRIVPPQTETDSQGPFYLANMSLCYDGEMLVSGPQQAASKKAAEQLAALALLELVSARSAVPDVVRVSQEDLARLQAANPKGRPHHGEGKGKEKVAGTVCIAGAVSLPDTTMSGQS